MKSFVIFGFWTDFSLLGTTLDDTIEVQKRIDQSKLTFNKYLKIWNAKKITFEQKIKYYKTLIISKLLYNCQTWSLNKKETKKLNWTIRKHLRRILHIFYPNKITNKLLYKKCKCQPIEFTIFKRRWNLYREILINEQIPAHKILEYYIQIQENTTYQKFKGKPRITILTTLKNDFKHLNLTFNNEKDLLRLKTLAKGKKTWEIMSQRILNKIKKNCKETSRANPEHSI